MYRLGQQTTQKSLAKMQTGVESVVTDKLHYIAIHQFCDKLNRSYAGLRLISSAPPPFLLLLLLLFKKKLYCSLLLHPAGKLSIAKYAKYINCTRCFFGIVIVLFNQYKQQQGIVVVIMS